MANKQRSKNKESILRKILRGMAMVMLALFLAGAVSSTVVGGYFFVNVMGTVRGDKVNDLDEMKASQGRTTIVYAYNKAGNPVEYARLHGEENRIWIELEDMGEPNPATGMPIIADAFIALEDKRFWEHQGVDWRRFLGAIRDEFTHGASTITQQLIKNLTGESQVQTIRKYREIMAALNMERHYDKITILEAYLNTINLNRGCYGVHTGAEMYFGKEVAELNIAEAASLAAITQRPTYFDPLRNPDNNRYRQLHTLAEMFEQGMISQAQYDEAVAFEMVFTNSPDFVPPPRQAEAQAQPEQINNYYVDFIIETVINDLMRFHGLSRTEATRRLYNGGLKIKSAVDMEIQEQMEIVFRERITFTNHVGRADNPINAAMAVMDYEGRVLGIVGGAGPKTRNRCLNRAAQSWRQPGSTIKSLTVYGMGIENNKIHWSTMTENSAFAYQGQMWPKNVDGTHGDGRGVTSQVALQRSHNTVAARITQFVNGVSDTYEFLANNFGFARLDPINDRVLPSMALGAMRNGMSPLELTAAYASIGNGGMYFSPFAYYEVLDSNGNLLLRSADEQVQKRAFSIETAKVLNEILQTVSTSEFITNNNGRHIGRFRTFGKTGTTNDNKDRWFAGGSPHYVGAVWFGYDIPLDLGRMTNPSGRIWMEVMNRIHNDDSLEASKNFPTTSRAVQRSYCTRTGLIAASSCPSASGWYRGNHIPRTCSGCQAAAPEPTAAPAQQATTRWFDAFFGGGATQAPATAAPTEAAIESPTVDEAYPW